MMPLDLYQMIRYLHCDRVLAAAAWQAEREPLTQPATLRMVDAPEIPCADPVAATVPASAETLRCAA